VSIMKIMRRNSALCAAILVGVLILSAGVALAADSAASTGTSIDASQLKAVSTTSGGAGGAGGAASGAGGGATGGGGADVKVAQY
jgi:hypothetical protein